MRRGGRGRVGARGERENEPELVRAGGREEGKKERVEEEGRHLYV